MKHKVIQTNKHNLFTKLAHLREARNMASQESSISCEATLPASQPSESVLHHGEKNNSSNPFSYQENSSRQRTKRLKTLVSSSLQPWRSSTFFNSYINFQKRTRLAGIISCILLLVLTAFAFHPVALETSSAEATTNPSTTTLTVETSGSTAVLDITPSSATGTFSSSDTSGTSLAFNVSTNNITGYNLSISHADSTTPAPLINEDTTSSSNPGSSSVTTNLDSLPTGTSISDSEFSGSTYVGYYGYKPSKLNSTPNSNYISAPTTTSTTLNVTECANNTTNCNTASDEYTIALGANIDYTKPAGTYTNTFILTAVANNVPYTINYLDNTGAGGTTGTDVSNLPDPESSSTATATNFTLSSTIPTRAGYTFAGWCYGTVTHNNIGNDTCTPSSTSGSSAAGDGVTYQPDSTFSFANYSSSTNVANLYAMWNVKTYTITLSRSGGASGIVIDGTTYTGTSVTLSYGEHTISGTYSSGYEFSSWSTSNSTNLSIASTSSASTSITVHGAATLTLNGKQSCTPISGYMQDFSPTSSTCDSGTLTDRRDNQEYLVGKLADGKWWLLDNLRLGSADFVVDTLDSTNTNVLSTNSMDADTFAGWNTTSGFDSYTAPMINTDSVNTVPTPTYGSASNKIGVYYNYCAASAGTYCMAEGSGSGNASYDVCPKGWRMPTGGSSGEYQNLCNKVKGSTCSNVDTSTAALQLRNVLSTPLSGYFYTSSASTQGSRGYFWSSAYSDGDYMYGLRVDSSSVRPQSRNHRYYGFPVRCVLKSGTIADATNMQTVTSAEINNSTEGETTTLKDVRDNQDYTVAKINGNLWMTQNLRFSGSTIDPTDTNIDTTKTISWSDLTSGNSYTAARYHNSGNTTNGYWYNYAGASAMTITGDSNSTDATYDICPKNWRLPTKDEFDGITSSSSAFSPLAGGRYYSGSIGHTGDGYWWSATAYDSNSTLRYYLRWDGSSLNINYTNRYNGFYVRCIRKSIDNTTYMQDVTAQMVADTEEGATATLRDKRDEQEYTVAKINGNLWMTRNLAIGCNGTGSTYGSAVSSKPLTSDDSNVTNTSSSPWNTPTAGLSNGNNYSTAYMTCDSTYGAWYNYAAASAGTIRGESNTTPDTYNICPKGWTLPTDAQQSDIISYSSAFSPVTGGRYASGSNVNTGYGFWWSATAYETTTRYYLRWNGSSLSTNNDYGRGRGLYIRCIHS